ncbi:treslin-like isoform X2 [Watersipora subatra]|uniref:treslin-like isoform X2 n=1 Tax=Watersipora subatra TaxID=2589382 RepID=UPI00355BA38C
MEESSCIAQVVFLIDTDIGKHLTGNPRQSTAPLRLACLRFLSTFKYNPAYRDLRWSYRFYSLSKSQLTRGKAARRHAAWKEFTTSTFEEFEDLLVILTKDVSADDTSQQENTEEAPKKVPAEMYSCVLCAVIEDFQWEIPDISSPVKSTRRHPRTQPMVKNYVFNFHIGFSSMQSLSTFTGASCTKPAHLVKAIMSKTAEQKWNEKCIGLFWVDSSPSDSHEDVNTKDFCRAALKSYGGNLISLPQIITLGNTAGLLPAALTIENHMQAPVTPVCHTIAKLLEPQVVSTEACRSKPLYICSSDNEKVLSLKVLTLNSQRLLPVEYLYICGFTPSHSVRLEYLDQSITYLCIIGGDNSTFPQFILDMTRQGTVLVLICGIDKTMYVLKALTVTTATLAPVKPTFCSLLQKRVNDKTLGEERVTTAFTGALIDPTAPPHRTYPQEISKVGHKDCSPYELLREAYRMRKLKSRLIEPAKGSKGDKPELITTIKIEKPSRLTRGSKCLSAVAEKKRSSLELPSKSSPNSAATSVTAGESATPARKKIVPTTLSSLNLDTEEELIGYAQKSYEEACEGTESLYLTAQKIVNTARVFYRRELNPQRHVEELLLSKTIKPVAAIRKNCVGKVDRKNRECQMCSLLLLELEVLKKEFAMKGHEEEDNFKLVSHLEEYLTCMSLGKPHLLKDFLYNQLIPSYQLTLAQVLATLLTELAQDLPTSLKKLLVAEDKKPLSLGSVNSRRSLPSPFSAMVPSFTSLLSEPGNSLLSSSMAGARNLQARSMSDKGQRSIAVPGELLKKSRKAQKLSSKGISSRTRSKTPIKDGEPLLTEFPTGFLSRLNEGQSLAGVRRSPRLAHQSHLSVSAATKVKRDLFSSPTSSSRRVAARSPYRPASARENSARDERGETKVLVAETPKHKQGALLTAPLNISPTDLEVVEETPAKAEPVTSSSQTDSSSVRRRLSRRKSFYDAERVKSRNVEKFCLLENRFKCSISAKCSPRKVSKLILKQALSQPTRRISRWLTPYKEYNSSPVKRPPRIHRKSAGNATPVADENLEPKGLIKKKLFASPCAPDLVCHLPPQSNVATASELPRNTLGSELTGKDGTHSESTSHEPIDSMLSSEAAVKEPQILHTPVKNKECKCGAHSPQKIRRSPRSCSLSHSQNNQITRGNSSTQGCGEKLTPRKLSPSTNRLLSLSTKRGSDTMSQENWKETRSFSSNDASSSGAANVKEMEHREQLPHLQFWSPSRKSVSLVQKFTPQHQRVQKQSPKYSPMSAGDLQSLLKSPFVTEEETESLQG